MANVKLKPCPFCGADPIEEPSLFSALHKTAYSIRCDNLVCNVNPQTRRFSTQAAAIRVWNRRAERHGYNADMSGDRNSFLCPKCGIFIKLKAYSATEEIDSNVKFCPNCGVRIDGGEDNG